jgi:hypothetical protein
MYFDNINYLSTNRLFLFVNSTQGSPAFHDKNKPQKVISNVQIVSNMIVAQHMPAYVLLLIKSRQIHYRLSNFKRNNKAVIHDLTITQLKRNYLTKLQLHKVLSYAVIHLVSNYDHNH